jgi:hypothetical protein|tara:strand:+ start:6791 stop:8299 length:1509 start_codon:yes stop_codon:yes gene_type:complete
LNVTIITNKPKVISSFLIIFFVGLGIRLYYFPFDLPLIIDALDYFTYATAVNYYGYLPLEGSPANNGWPIFLSFWFSIINLDDTLQYMQLQRIISIILSSLIAIPVYVLCRKFFDEKIALVGSALFAFDPRIILNSLLGIGEPLFILLSITSLLFFLRYRNKEIIISFVLASFATIVRSEAVFLFFALTILFFIKYRFSKEILKTYLPALVIFFLILTPIMIYKIEVNGDDAIFQRVAVGSVNILSNASQEGTDQIVNGLELFLKYLGWIMIPNFLIFVPFGIIQFFRNRTKETNFIIIVLIVTSLPILYGYTSQAQDTRYLYVLYPIFCLISLFAVKTYISKISKKDIVVMLIIVGIFTSSIVFYEFKKIDYEKEREFNEIGKIISKTVSGLNYHPDETRYIRASEIPNEWPFLFNDDNHKIKTISTSNYQNLDDFISNSKGELTHLIVDENNQLPEFLTEIYYEEVKYEYLTKVFDSKEDGFNHHIMLFKINFEKFDSVD